MFYIFYKFNIIINRKSDSWNIKFSIIFWNIAPDVGIASLAWAGGSTFKFSVAAGSIDISEIINYTFLIENSFISSL